MKITWVAALTLILAASTATAGQGAAKKPAQKPAPVSAPLCAEDTCLKFRQAANIALYTSKLDLVLVKEDEYQKKIPSAHDEMVTRGKAHRDKVRPLYSAALASVSRSPAATAALKEYMVIWTAAINAVPDTLSASPAKASTASQSYDQRLNDAWARVELEAEL